MIRNNKTQLTVPNKLTFLNEFWIQYLIIFGLILFISLLFPSGQSLKYAYQLNDITREPIIAPFTFSILKTDKRYQQDLNERKKSIPFVFNRDKKIIKSRMSSLEQFFIDVNVIFLQQSFTLSSSFRN